MSRKKLSEFRAKTLINDSLGRDYQVLEVDAASEEELAVQELSDNSQASSVWMMTRSLSSGTSQGCPT